MKQQLIKIMENAIRKEYKNIAGITIMKNDNLVYEKYFNGCTESNRIHIFSVTKSIISILCGIAIDQRHADNDCSL